MIPFNFERLEHHHYQSSKKSNVTSVQEKDESFKWGTFHQDPSYHRNDITGAIPHFTKDRITWKYGINLEIRRRDLGVDEDGLMKANF